MAALSFYLLLTLMILLSLFRTSRFAEVQCHADDSFALMEFHISSRTNTTDWRCIYPKVDSWSLDGSGDCCSWDGVKCDQATGRVIALDLSSSCLSGTISPNTTIFRLVHLESLNLAYNSFNFSPIPYGFRNLSRLKYLDLSCVSLSSSILPVLANFSSLTSLGLRLCGLNGDFPVSIFQLPHLEVLDISLNSNLSGFFPKLHWGSPLKYLDLYQTNFSGEIPASIGNLSLLSWLDARYCYFSGSLPSSLGNLSHLTTLNLGVNNLQGQIPVSFANLTQLSTLFLDHNNLSGDTLEWVVKLKNLTGLSLSFNNISFTKSFINTTTSKLTHLDLESCNLTEFPHFIGYLSKLVALVLSHNRIRGTIPRWMWNNSKESLEFIDLSQNLLTNFENNHTDLPLPSLVYLDISSNFLETTLPVPFPSIMRYNISNNFLFGEVPTSICELSTLGVLDLSNNALNGTIPPCLGSIGPLLLLNLARNKFDGMIPDIYLDGCALRMIDLSENRLRGIVPRSLGNCGMLVYLNLGDNQINDTFPLWLSELAYLKVIGLQSNKFHGPIEGHVSQFNFTSLHILDLSNNSFNGKLPSKLLQSCRAMNISDGQDKLAYMDIQPWLNMSFAGGSLMTCAMTLMNKGTERKYAKIPDNLAAIDLSSNKFEGFIPELIGDLKSLRMLNLSNNFLTGRIPPSLANLIVLESLDLSLNNLAGEIPQQLASLTFLEVFNVSHNRLSGRIPRGTQFDTFGSSSFAKNEGLCGSPLPDKCPNGDNTPPPPSSFKVDNEEESLFDLDWKIVLAGAGVGFLVGVVLGNSIIDEKSRWFLYYSKRMAKGCKR